MIDPKLLFLLASGVVAAITLMLLFGFGFNAYGQLKVHGEYNMPADFVNIIKAALAAAVSCLVWSARALGRKREAEKKDQ